MTDYMKMIAECRGYYKRKGEYTPLNGTEEWALEHLAAHEIALLGTPMPEPEIIRDILGQRTASLHRHLFGGSQ